MSRAQPLRRKRAQVSYAEDDDNDIKVMEDDGASVSEGDDASDSDLEYSVPKAKKSTRKPKKRAKTAVAAGSKALVVAASRPNKHFRLFDLPAELRNHIYDSALVPPQTVALLQRLKAYRRVVVRGFMCASGSRVQVFRPSHPASVLGNVNPKLLAVNKRVKSEAIVRLYQQHFILDDAPTLHTFLTSIGPDNRALLSQVTVLDWATGGQTNKAWNVASMTMASTCLNLTSLRFDCDWGPANAQQIAGQVYRESHFFLEAYAAARGGVDAAIEVVDLKVWDPNPAPLTSTHAPATKDAALCKEFKEDFQNELKKLLS